jgi:hypothetical protein
MTRVFAAKRLAFPLLLVGALALAGCSGMNTTEQRTLSGGAIGAGVGVVGTALTGGCIWCGAAIGSAVGAGAGFIYDQSQRARQ